MTPNPNPTNPTNPPLVDDGFDRRDLRGNPPAEKRSGRTWLIVLCFLALGALAWWLGRLQAAKEAAPRAVSAPTVAAPAPVAAAPAAPVAAPPAEAASAVVMNPIEDAPALALPALDASDNVVRKALIDWVGDKAVNGLLRSDDFVRRVVVTVDNLGREHAAPRLWPANPVPGRFLVQRVGEAETIAPENAARYQTLVTLITSVEPARAATLYRQHYPLFQQAYKELGYPNAAFNDRMVAVIDRLLATPEPAQPPTVRKVDIKGEVAGPQGSNFYEFADPAYDRLTAGQKLLLRMGTDHARKVKAQLRAFRAAIAKPSAKG